jgi:hypothetical protein
MSREAVIIQFPRLPQPGPARWAQPRILVALVLVLLGLMVVAAVVATALASG